MPLFCKGGQSSSEMIRCISTSISCIRSLSTSLNTTSCVLRKVGYVIFQLPFMSRLHLVRFLDFMNHLPLRVIKVNLYPVQLYFLIFARALGIGIFMNQLSFKHQVGSVLHVYTIGKQPKFPFAYLVIVKMSSCKHIKQER